MRMASDWTTQTAARQQTLIAVNAGNTLIAFDPEHLRRILINLLDNALRYASPTADSIEVSTSSGHQARLSVWSDGAPLENPCKPICLNLSFHRKAVPADWACIFAGSCASAMAR